MDVEENVEDFLQRVKQLDSQRQKEDDERRKKLEDDIQSYKMRDSFNISIPNPVPRDETSERSPSPPALPKRKPNLSSIPNSESLQNFNQSVSRQYRLNIDDLVYESAYNYEKSQNGNSRAPPTSHTEELTRSFTEYSKKSGRDYELPKRSSTIFNPSNGNDTQFRATTGGLTKGLVYEEYERSRTGDDEPFRASTGSPNRERSYKKYDNIPDIIRFDDAIHKPLPNFRSSRYSKYQLTDEQKKEMDSTIKNLVGDGYQLSDNKENENQEEEEQPDKIIPKPLTRERKGGMLPSSLSNNTTLSPPFQSKPSQSNTWSSAAKDKPALAAPSSLSQLKRSPRKTELTSPTKIDNSTSPIRSDSITSPIKKSPAKLDFSRFTKENDSNDKTPPPLAPKPLGFKNTGNDAPKRTSWLSSAAGKTSSAPQWQDTTANYQINKNGGGSQKQSWLNSAARNSSSTPQWQDTSANYEIEKNGDSQKPSWLNSATRNSSSTPQWQDTTSKIHVESSEDKQKSWLNSAMRNTSHREFEIPKSKIKPIVPSKSNTLQEKLKKEEESKEKQHLTLKELEAQKLNHIDSPARQLPKFEPEEASFSPTILKKTRTGSPSKNLSVPDKPDFLKTKLLPASKSPSPEPESPEAISHKSNLKPPLPKRKPSLKVPEALQKAEKLKPALPARKPSIEIPEALAKKGKLRQAEKQEQAEEPTPEAVNKKSQLKPAVPQRKLSHKEVEALAQLNKIKSKKTGVSPPETKPKPRVFSNSKEVLQNQLGSLKSTKGSLQKDEHSLNLEKMLTLKKASTDSELKPVRLPFMATTDEIPTENDKPPGELKKASTFDSADLTGKQNKESTENLEHLTKKRAKGPKRRTRAPKNV